MIIGLELGNELKNNPAHDLGQQWAIPAIRYNRSQEQEILFLTKIIGI